MLNLMPWREVDFRRKQWKLIMIALLMVGITFFVQLSVRFIYHSRLEKLMLVGQSLRNQIQRGQVNRNNILMQLNQNARYKNHYAMLMKQKLIVSILIEISKIFPGNSRLVSIVYDQRGISLEGIFLGENYEAIKNFEAEFQRKLNLKIKMLELKPLGAMKNLFKFLISLPEIKI